MYDHNDFVQNPGKYQSFKTAIVNKSIVTHNAENDLQPGEIVGIKYAGTVKNHLYQRNEPLYEVTRIGGHFYGHVYANALKDFVL